MIAQLTGTLIESDFTETIIDVNGVGYAVSVPLSTSEALPAPGSQVTLLTTLVVREDELHLYGFATAAERRLFTLLTGSVSGIGPKLALNVLSCMSVEAFASAVLQSDLKTLGKISGVGKRTAERMVVELRDKVTQLSLATGTAGTPATTAAATADGRLTTDSAEARDAVLALETLGFKHDQAEKAVGKVLEAVGGKASTAELIRKALALLNS